MSDGSSWSVIVGSHRHGVISSVTVLQYVEKEVKETHDRPEHQSSSALKWFQSQLTNLEKNNPHLNGIVFEELVLDLNAKSLFEELPRLDRVDKASHPPE